MGGWLKFLSLLLYMRVALEVGRYTFLHILLPSAKKTFATVDHGCTNMCTIASYKICRTLRRSTHTHTLQGGNNSFVIIQKGMDTARLSGWGASVLYTAGQKVFSKVVWVVGWPAQKTLLCLCYYYYIIRHVHTTNEYYNTIQKHSVPSYTCFGVFDKINFVD